MSSPVDSTSPTVHRSRLAQARAALCSMPALVTLGLLLALLLLAAFHQVLSTAVAQAGRVHSAASQRIEAASRCADVPAAPLRDLCRAQVDAGLTALAPATSVAGV
ncbi:hypothetical protein [Eleftheria terrae]|uniref:hypothetical protein n=1 Tax=Eleftheria terrae TaxID=1597781 RepID=UPI00263A498A|nr:hypothetical protein [Eleftheria terrae]WKB54867.1 hypothetical protein N7L95_10990 [Eleftheria terrae]